MRCLCVLFTNQIGVFPRHPSYNLHIEEFYNRKCLQKNKIMEDELKYTRKQKDPTQMRELELDKLLVDASKNGDESTVKLLLDQGACPDATEYNRSLFYASKNYTTPLQNAAAQGFSNIVRCLVENGGEIIYR